MPRRVASRLVLPGFACCYHITQRCQERRDLLRHAKDRRQYLKRLWETSRRHPVSVLNYMITSNHVHLLLWSESPRHVSAAMQYRTCPGPWRRTTTGGWTGKAHSGAVGTGRLWSRTVIT